MTIYKEVMCKVVLNQWACVWHHEIKRHTAVLVSPTTAIMALKVIYYRPIKETLERHHDIKRHTAVLLSPTPALRALIVI